MAIIKKAINYCILSIRRVFCITWMPSFIQLFIFMFRILIVILLLSIALTINQRCTDSSEGVGVFQRLASLITTDACPKNSHCLQNGYCACDEGYIGNCSQAAITLSSNVQASATISNEAYTFFKISADSQSYIMLLFTLCHTEASTNLETIDVWDDNGDLSVFDHSSALSGGKNWSIAQGCIKLNTPFMVFSKQPNGMQEQFVLGLILANPGSINLTLTVQVQQLDFWDLITKILLILGACFLLTLVIAIVYLIFKWKRRRNHIQTGTVEGDITHFQTYMPKFKLNQSINVEEQTCSVCLLDLNGNQWLRKTVCGHVFHQDCLDEWCKSNINCPICRKSFQHSSLRQQSELSRALSESQNQSILRSNLL